MKKLLTILFFCIAITTYGNDTTHYFPGLPQLWNYKYTDPLAATYYVSPSGSDGNAGTIGSPWLTWEFAISQLDDGDILYIRGGTYQTPNVNDDERIHIQNINGSSGSHITVSAYPGESPILSFTNITVPTNSTGFRMDDCSWIDFIGLRITGLATFTAGQEVAGWSFWDCTDMTFTRCEVDHINGVGFAGRPTCNNLTFTNCDAHHCGDPHSGTAYGDADGFDMNTGVTTYINCRAWWNSDDGFDCFGNDSYVTYTGCWSFWNGYIPGGFSDPGSGANGNGFKWGSNPSDIRSTVKRRYQYCVSFENKVGGFDQNAATCGAEFYNNTIYDCPEGFRTGWSLSPYASTFYKNNVEHDIGTLFTDPADDGTGDHNSWDIPITVTDADFVSVSSANMDDARQSDGSLPVVTFLHLVSGSDLRGAGTNGGIGLNLDLGAFPFSVTIPPVIRTIQIRARISRQ